MLKNGYNFPFYCSPYHFFSLLFVFNFAAATQKMKKNGTIFRHNLAENSLPKCREDFLHWQFPCCCCSISNVSLMADSLSVRCSGANSLEHILFALGPLLKRWPNVRLDLLRMEHTPMPVFYLDSLRVLPPIRRLHLHNNSLAHLLLHRRPSNLAQRQNIDIFDSLEELAITSNELANFWHFSAAIATLRSLRSLSLSANRLVEVPAHIFLHFHSRNRIERLDLSVNLLRDNSLPPEAFLGLGFLQKLSLDKNQLETVPVKAINELADSLEELCLGANRIEETMPAGEGLALARLKTLNLEANKISAIDGEFFRGIPSLFYLHLSNNRFSTIVPQMFAFIRGLKVLSMNQNPISRLDSQTFQLAPSLLRLEVAQCRIAQIDGETFDAVPKMQFIHLGDNRMSSIGWHIFAGKLPFLVSLDLSNNLISHIDQFAFANLAQLQLLNLSGNRVKSLAKNTFDGTFFGPDTLSNGREINLIDCRTLNGTEWVMEFPEGVTLQGSCEVPTELIDVPLTNKRRLIAYWTTDQSKDSDQTLGTGTNSSITTTMANNSGNWSSSTWLTTTTAVEEQQKSKETPAERRREMKKEKGRTIMGKSKESINSSSSREQQQFGAVTETTASSKETEHLTDWNWTKSDQREEQHQHQQVNAAVFVLVLVFIFVGLLLTAFLCCRQLTASALSSPANGKHSKNSRQVFGKKNGKLSWDKLKMLFSLPFCPPGRRFSANCEKHSVPPTAISRHRHQSERRKKLELSVQNWENEPYFWPMFHDKAFFEVFPQQNHCQHEQMEEKQRQKEQQWRVTREMFWF